MLTNTFSILGKDGKELDAKLAEINKLKAEIEDMEETRKQLTEEVKEITKRHTEEFGKFETSKFYYNLTFVSGKETVAVAKLKKADNGLYELLLEQGYISKGADTIQLRNTQRKE